MARAIPETMPDVIAERIYQGWGDMKSFAADCDIPYTRIYTMMMRSNHRTLYKLDSIAITLGVTPEVVAKTFLQPTEAKRRAAFQALCEDAGISRNELSRRSRISTGELHKIFSGDSSGENYRNYLTIAKKLGLTLRELLRCFENRAA